MDISNISLSSLQRPDPTQMRQQLFKKTDADGSGSITKQELTDAISARSKPPGAGETPDVDQMFSAMDTDSNGEVSQAEHDTFLEKQDAERGGQPRSSGGFEGSTSMLTSLLAALQGDDEDETSTEVSTLIAKLVESLKERSSSYSADGSGTSSGAKSLFQTDV